MIQAYWN